MMQLRDSRELVNGWIDAMKRFFEALNSNALRFLAIGVAAAVAIALLVIVEVNSRAKARLQQKIAALRSADMPVSIVELRREGISPESNAATYLLAAQADVDSIQKDVSAVDNAAPQIEQNRFQEGHLSPALKKAIESAFESHPQVLGLLEEAADCPGYNPLLNTCADTRAFQETALANMSSSRVVMRVLRYQALRQISDGQQEAALGTCLLMFRLCRHFENEPMMTGYQATAAYRGMYAASSANLALRAGPVSEASRDALEVELARAETVEPLKNALISERAFGLDRYGELTREIGFGPIGPLWLKNDACGYIDLFEEAIALAGRRDADAQRALTTSTAVANAGPMTQMLVPVLRSLMESACRDRAQTRALRILNALAQGRRGGFGRAETDRPWFVRRGDD